MILLDRKGRMILHYLLFFLLIQAGSTSFMEGDILVSSPDTSSAPGVAGGVQLADPSRMWPDGKVYYR